MGIYGSSPAKLSIFCGMPDPLGRGGLENPALEAK